MVKAAGLAHSLKDWLKSRPRLEIDESATWFLLLFVYAHGPTTDGLSFKRELSYFTLAAESALATL